MFARCDPGDTASVGADGGFSQLPQSWIGRRSDVG